MSTSFTLYNSNSYQNPQTTTYDKTMTIKSIEDLKNAHAFDMIMCGMQSHYRKKENALSANVLWCDFDDSITIKEFQDAYAGYEYYIATSKSHQVEKHDIICDRFHVFFPTGKDIPAENLEKNLKKLIETMHSDPACKDVSRFFFGNKDTQIIYNDGESIVSLLYLIEDEKPIPFNVPKTSGKDRIDDFESKTYLEKACKKALRDCIGKIENASEGSRNSTLFKQICVMFKWINGGRPIETDWMEQITDAALGIGLESEEIVKTFISAEKTVGKEGFGFVINNKKENIYDLAAKELSDRYDVKYNVITQQTEFCVKGTSVFNDLDDYNFNSIFIQLQRIEGLKWLKPEMLRTLLKSEMVEKYDPFKSYLDNLSKWDGIDHIARFKEYVPLIDPADNDMYDLFLRRWFVGVVSQMLSNPLPNKMCFVLHGEQNIGKTALFRNLCIDSRYYFSGVIERDDKDSRNRLSTCQLINLDELERSGKGDFSHLKSLLGETIITIRRPYDRFDCHLQRHASFCGSINQDTFLSDHTGNSRWCTFTVGKIQHEAITPEVRDQFFSQAYAMYKAGAQSYLNEEEAERINKHVERYTITSLEDECVAKHVESSEDSGEEMTTSEISLALEGRGYKCSIKSIATALKKQGYTNRHTRRGTVYPVKINRHV
jgi:predicted P-loop ATPase